ncbi:hypothetical protein [Providencia sp. PROV150]|uniref:hypothetical protein n=1 Tax=Providencia sp. PROV150 TaxID=2949860 RepID=UPI00234B01E9|nr:hypothetical protein [Providencia sp. PROV150]
MIRYLQEHGAEVVAAFEINKAVIGKNIGEITGTRPTEVKVQALHKADKTLETLKLDVGIIAHLSVGDLSTANLSAVSPSAILSGVLLTATLTQ